MFIVKYVVRLDTTVGDVGAFLIAIPVFIDLKLFSSTYLTRYTVRFLTPDSACSTSLPIRASVTVRTPQRPSTDN